MTKTTFSFQRYATTSMIALTLLTEGLAPQIAASSTANFTSQAKPSQSRKIRFTRPPLKKLGAPIGSYRGGGSKGKCPPVSQPLTALVPVYDLNPDKTRPVWALTVSDRPTFWFYVPYTLTQELPVEFVLQDSQGKQIYKTQFTQNNSPPGILKIQLPATVPSLELEAQYRWYLLIQCDSIGTHVEGVIERQQLSPALQRQLQGKDPREKAALYAENGIWYDALTALAELSQSQPGNSDVLSDWQSFLRSAGLEAIVSFPVTDCCSSIENSQK